MSATRGRLLRRTALRLGVTSAALAALVVAAPSHGAPSNDAFASARLINAASGSVTGTTANATVESGEPALAKTPQNTIWYRFTTRTARTVVFDISASKPASGSSEYALGTAYTADRGAHGS
jgi:hypothetical protein